MNLEPLLKDLVFLESKGIFVFARNVEGTVQCVMADNLGAHSIGGFVEKILGQFPCRFCLGQRADYQLKEVRTGEFQLRTKQERSLHVQTVLHDQRSSHCFGVKKPVC